MLPRLLKLVAAALTGAAALLAFQRLHRDALVSSLRREIRDALLHLCRDGAPPPSIAFAGFHGQGRSSLINTAVRALAGESGPLLLRAETAPPGSAPATVARRCYVAVGEAGEAEEWEVTTAAVELVDAPPLPDAAGMVRADVEAALEGGAGVPAPECLVVVMRCSGPTRERILAMKRTGDIAGIARERGLHLVVVLTHKKALKTKKQAEELRREVAFRARTDCIYRELHHDTKHQPSDTHQE